MHHGLAYTGNIQPLAFMVKKNHQNESVTCRSSTQQAPGCPRRRCTYGTPYAVPHTGTQKSELVKYQYGIQSIRIPPLLFRLIYLLKYITSEEVSLTGTVPRFPTPTLPVRSDLGDISGTQMTTMASLRLGSTTSSSISKKTTRINTTQFQTRKSTGPSLPAETCYVGLNRPLLCNIYLYRTICRQ